MTFDDYLKTRAICLTVGDVGKLEEEVIRYMRESWGEAVKQEREQCAKLCYEIENKYWAAFKGKTQPIDREAVYSPHVEGMSDGAGECGSAIRARSG